MVGQTVSSYRILERLGAGGMGVVYRAEDTRLERPVALKFLSEELTKNPSSMGRLLREAKAASALHHQNIRSIFAFEEHEGRQFIVMELLDGHALDHVIGASPLPADVLLSYAIQVTDALDVAHARGIVHRDIKPANLFVSNSGLVKVLDFGLAKTDSSAPRDSPASDDQPTVGQLTDTGTTIGTASYMAPEQVRGERADQRSDLFSFGAVLFEMATGHRAFAGPTLGVIFDAILNRAPVRPTSLNGELPASIEGIIVKALDKDPARRYQNAAAMRADLQQALQALASGSALRITPPPPRRSRRAAAAAITVAVVGLGAAGLWTATARASYYPCVVIGEFQGVAEDVPPKLIEFQLKRALTQMPKGVVFDQRGYELALQAEARPASTGPAWRRWLPWGGSGEPDGPAVRLTAGIRPSIGNIGVTLTIATRGRTETLPLAYKGVTELLDQGIDDMARLAVARFNSGNGQPANQAPASYRSARTLLSDHLDAVRSYWRGREAWSHLDPQAERDVQRALEIDPDFALARLLLSEIRVFQSQMKSAEAEIERALQVPKALTEAEKLRGLALLARASLSASEERTKLQRLIELEGSNREYIFELGESYFHTADIDDARQQYERVLRLQPDYAKAYNHLGYCYAWSGQHAAALRAFDQYLKLDKSANAWDSLGDAYLNAGEYANAASAKNKALAQGQNLYYARNSLAAIAILTGRFTQADLTLRAALAETALPLDRARFQASRAYLELRAGRLDAASEACRTGLALVGPSSDDTPTEELLWLQGQVALARPGAPALAAAGPLARLQQIVEKGRISEANYRPPYKYWLHLSALVDAADGRKAEASAHLDDLEHVKDKLGYWGSPYDRSFFLDAVGRVRETLGDSARAERAYRDAFAYNAHYALAHFHLAMLLHAERRADEARREFEAFLTEWRGADRSVPELRQVAALGLPGTIIQKP
jgi:tetratricopeptide (TPR) repeat protein